MAHLVRSRPETFRRRAHELWRRHRAGELQARVTAFPLAAVASAHTLLRRRESVGKCVLQVNGDR
jgi:NADPH:quinone reductase-like Zn-dependent oxidoreductase